MTTFIDSHAHLADPQFADDVDAVLARARAAGTLGVVCIGESPAAAARARGVAARHPGFVWFTAGVHPHDAGAFDAGNDLGALRAHAAAGAVAIGECGLDYHYGFAERDAQLAAFRAQVQLASAVGLPLVVHTREAEDDTRDVLREAAGAGVCGVLHCYTGSPALAEFAVGAGWFVSFSGIVTFRTWRDEELLRCVPDDRLLLESDAPYLAPVPHRGRRNEPAWCARTLERLAVARGTTPEALGERVAANARALFRLAAPVTER